MLLIWKKKGDRNRRHFARYTNRFLSFERRALYVDELLLIQCREYSTFPFDGSIFGKTWQPRPNANTAVRATDKFNVKKQTK